MNKLELLKKYYSLCQRIKKLKEEKQKLKDEIKSRMKGRDVIEAGCFEAEMSEVVKEFLDKDRLYKYLGSKVKKYTKVKKYKRLDVRKLA